MPIKTIKRSNIGQIRDRLEKRLKAFEEAHGLKAHVGSMRFTDKNVVIKLTLSVIDEETGVVHNPERDDFILIARKYGLSPKLLDQRVSTPQGVFKIVGYRSRARKNKFLIEDLRGKKFVCNYAQLKLWLTNDKNTLKYVNESVVPNYGSIVGETLDERQKELEAELAFEKNAM